VATFWRYQLLFTFGLALILNELIIVMFVVARSGAYSASCLAAAILVLVAASIFGLTTFFPKYRLFVMVMAGCSCLLDWCFWKEP
jgi:hypothetical protein